MNGKKIDSSDERLGQLKKHLHDPHRIYFVHETQLAKRYLGYISLDKDLDFVLKCIDEYENCSVDTIKQSLWFSLAIIYSKCFKEADGRRVKLEKKDVFKERQDLLPYHKELEVARDQYIAHGGISIHEVLELKVEIQQREDGKTYFYLRPDGLKSIGAYVEHIEMYKEVIRTLKHYVRNKFQKIGDKVLKEEVAKFTEQELAYKFEDERAKF